MMLQNLMKVGMLTQNDVLKLEVQHSDAKYKQVDANNARYNLRWLL